MLKGQNILTTLKDELTNPVVILDKNETIIWCNKSMSQLIHKDLDWNSALKKNFKTVYSESTHSKVLSSLKHPTKTFEVKSQIMGDKRYLELKDIIVKQVDDSDKNKKQNIGPIIEDLAEDFSQEFTSQEIRFDIFCHDVDSMIPQDKLYMGLSYFLKAVTQVSTKTQLKMECTNNSESEMKFSITIENLSHKKLEMTKNAIQRKSILFLQRTEEVLSSYTPNISIQSQSQDHLMSKVIFSLCLVENKQDTNIVPPPYITSC